MKIKDASIFIVESDTDQRAFLRTQLLSHGATVSEFESLDEVYPALKQKVCNLLILNLSIDKGFDGLRFMLTLKEQGLDLPMIVTSPVANEEIILAALKAGADRYLVKPYSPWDLIKMVRKILFPTEARAKRYKFKAPLRTDTFLAAEVLQLNAWQVVIRSGLSFKIEGAVVEVKNHLCPQNVRESLVGQVVAPSRAGVTGFFKTILDLEGLSEKERDELKKVAMKWR